MSISGSRCWQRSGVAPEAMLGFTADAGFRGRPVHLLQGAARGSRSALRHPRARSLPSTTRVERHVEEQIARGRLCLVEMDSFFMPDTQRRRPTGSEHGKTTVAINRLDRRGQRARLFPQWRLFPARRRGFRRAVSAASDGKRRAVSALYGICTIPGKAGRRRAICARRRGDLLVVISPGVRAKTRSAPLPASFRNRSRRWRNGRSASSINTPSTRFASWAPISSWRPTTSPGCPPGEFAAAAEHAAR